VQPLLQWKRNEYYATRVCVCSLKFPPWNAHVLRCHLWPAPLYSIFLHYLIKARFSGEKIIGYIMCFSSFCTTFVWNIFQLKKNWARYYGWSNMCIGLHVKYPLFLSDYNDTWIFATDFSKNTQISNFMKSVHWEPSFSMRADGRTDGPNTWRSW